MILKRIIYILTKISITSFIKLNFLSKHVVREGKGYILPAKKAHFLFSKGSKIVIKKGNFIVGEGDWGAVIPTCVSLKQNSQIIILDSNSIVYGADILCEENALLILGSGYINGRARIRCAKEIEIGEDHVISTDFNIYDANGHTLNGENFAEKVAIGKHVWIGTRVTILAGVTVGDGCVVGAGAIVTSDLPSQSLSVGVPTRVIKENVSWK